MFYASEIRHFLKNSEFSSKCEANDRCLFQHTFELREGFLDMNSLKQAVFRQTVEGKVRKLLSDAGSGEASLSVVQCENFDMRTYSARTVQKAFCSSFWFVWERSSGLQEASFVLFHGRSTPVLIWAVARLFRHH
jgi:hypothetical protein